MIRMKSLLAVVVATIYFALSVGLSIHVHQCNVTDLQVSELMSEEVVQINDDCHAGSTHSCCSEKKEISCCAKTETKDDCCVDATILIHLDDEQLVSKSQFLTFILINSVDNHLDLLPSDYEEASGNYRYIYPPPVKEDRHIRFCSLTLYG